MKTYNLPGTNIRALGLLIVTTMLLLSACIAPMDQMPAEADGEGQKTAMPDASGSELTIEQLGNATYSGIYDEPVTLSDGVYEGAPLVEGGAARPTVMLVDNSALYGDLDGDGVADATVLLAENSGGSGVFTYVGGQLNQEGQPTDAGTVLLGDRTQIISGVIEDEQVTINVVTQGPDDPMCCPTSKMSNSYALQDGMLAQAGSEDMGNVSLDDLMGTSWVFTGLAQDTPALPDAPVTAAFADGQITGSAGCNSYNAAVSSEGGQRLTVGPSMSTMMACPDPIMAQETAYLTALQSAVQWSYFIGQLAITYQNEDGSIGVLYYASASESMAANGDSAAGANEFTYLCADDVTIMAAFDNDNRTATVTLPDGTQTLPQVEAASGAKYSDGTTTFWTQGDDAFVQVNDETVIDDCTVQAE